MRNRKVENMKRYFFVADVPPRKKTWSPSLLRATPFPSKSGAETAITMFGIVGATGTEEFHDMWYVVKDSGRKT
jgi:hypothetical protein